MSTRKSSVHPVTQSHNAPAANAAEVQTHAEHGKEEILRLQEILALAPALPTAVRKHFAVWTRAPLAALEKAVSLHAKYGAKVGDFDADAVNEAIAYEQAVTPLLDAAKEFVRRLEDSVIAKRASIGKMPLGVVFALRAALRYGNDASVKRDLDDLESLVSPKRTPSAKSKGASPPTTEKPAVTNGSPPVTNGANASTRAVDVTVRSVPN